VLVLYPEDATDHLLPDCKLLFPTMAKGTEEWGEVWRGLSSGCTHPGTGEFDRGGDGECGSKLLGLRGLIPQVLTFLPSSHRLVERAGSEFPRLFLMRRRLDEGQSLSSLMGEKGSTLEERWNMETFLEGGHSRNLLVWVGVVGEEVGEEVCAW